MECVFVNYPKTICYIGSEMGPCPPGMNNFAFNLGTEANQVDYFDAIMGRPGTYIIPAGQIQCDASGRCSTGTGSFGFDDQLWSQTWTYIEASGGEAPTTGYVEYRTWSPAQSATFSAPGESVEKTGFIHSLGDTFDKVESGQYSGCGTTICVVQVVIAPGAGGVTMTIQVVDVNTSLPVGTGWGQSWSFPAPY